MRAVVTVGLGVLILICWALVAGFRWRRRRYLQAHATEVLGDALARAKAKQRWRRHSD